MFNEENSVNQKIDINNSNNVELWIKREDLIHNVISGNKYRKLKYNIALAKKNNYKTLLTFGGAFSNHIAAVAEAGRVFGFKTIGIIRGEELECKLKTNPTLSFAKNCGMQFKFVSRSEYRLRHNSEYIEGLKSKFESFFCVPEGGTNALGVKGCEAILTNADAEFDYVCVPVGTGGTISGIINCSQPGQQVLGFSALKGDFLQEDIAKFATKINWTLISDYHFGGYAKTNDALISFINTFKTRYNIPLDPVYTGKMLYGIFDLIATGFFPKHSKVLSIHTGGLQGVKGVNTILKTKGKPLLI